ncbi:MAG: PrsW family intramembrane metalloprotease [Candidatus Micrarchaeia archaeon]
MEILAEIGIFFFIIFAISIFITYNLIKKFHNKKEIVNVFTIKNKKRKMKDLLFNILFSPVYWIVQIGIIASFCLILLSLMIQYFNYSEEQALAVFLASGLISFSIAIMYATIIWITDYKHKEPLAMFPTLFLWGCTAAVLSFFINTSIIYGFGYSQINSVIVSPFVEEGLKIIGLLILSKSRKFNGIFDGLVFGFIIGTGFAFIEDWVYYTQNSPIGIGIYEWVSFIFARSILAGAGHGIFTAIAGAGIAIAKERKEIKWTIFGFVGAVLIHSIFNYLSIIDGISRYAVDTRIHFSSLYLAIMLILFSILFFELWKKEEKSVC